MTQWQMLAAGGILLVLVGLIVVAGQLSRLSRALSAGKKPLKGSVNAIGDSADQAAEDVFDKEFHEELRNRGRLHFEKIINENSMFLKQDLDMTIAQLNQYLKKEIGDKLQLEFADYAKAMQDAQELALAALHKSASAVDEQRTALEAAMKKDVAEREAALLAGYEQNMAKIVEHYLLQTLGDQFDLKSQLPFILEQMEANKQKIMDDMRL